MKEIEDFYKKVIFAEKVHDVNFQEIAKVLFNEVERLNKECDTYMKIATKKDNLINKAIEYIEDNVVVYAFNNKSLPHWELNDDEIKELLDILKGSDKNIECPIGKQQDY